MKITLTEDHLKLHEIASKDETRHHLVGVNIDLELKEAAATDGHALVFLPIDNIPEESNGAKGFLIPTESCKDLLRLMKKIRIPAVELDIDENLKSISFNYDGIIHAFKIYNYGNFPDYKQIVPKYSSNFSVNFNPELLFQIKKALNKKKNEGLTLEFSDNKKDTIKVLHKGKLYGCFMPMKD